MIRFSEEYQCFKLDTPCTSYVMSVADGKYLGHVYYGRKIYDMDIGYLLRTGEPPFVPSVNQREKVSFLDSFPMEYSFGGTGDFRESCLDIRTKDGKEGLELIYETYRIIHGKPSLKGLPATWGDSCDSLEIVMRDKATNLRVVLLYTSYSDVDVITRSVKIINKGIEPVFLNRVLSACMDMDEEEFQLLTLHGSWARERHLQKCDVKYGGYVTESLRGESGHQDHPFLALVSKDCTQTSGQAYGMHLIYSGNFIGKVQKNQFCQIRAVIGIHPEHFCWKLEPGESFQAPEAVLVYSDEGLGKMTRTFHDLYRNHLIRSPWKDRERPVLINNWEATYFDFDSDKLLEIAGEASKSGIEMLVMDDGWFGKREADNSSLGDWFVNVEKIKGGLKKLVDGVNKLGMKFGIWFEPEMISPDSELYRRHPDWVLKVNGREPALCRAQLVLDLSRPEVVEYVYGCISDILHSANIEYIKWDMNRPIADMGSGYLPEDRQGELIHRHNLAVYELQERLLQEFPELLLENCSGGGARFDPGMLYYSPQIWCSDDTDAIERLMIQEGTQLLYPLSAIGAHVSDCPNHITGRSTPFDTRGIVASTGAFGYELDVTKISEEDRNKIPQQIAWYKKYCSLIQKGDYYRIASYGDNRLYDCTEVVSKDKKYAMVTYVQVLAEPNVRSRKIKLQGLREEGVYRVSGKTYRGGTLMYAGILIEPLRGDFQAKILEVCEEELLDE